MRGRCIGVSLQRGKIAPDDGRYVRVDTLEIWTITNYGSDVGDAESAGDPSGIFERLPCPNGKKYFFEFRPLTEGMSA